MDRAIPKILPLDLVDCVGAADAPLVVDIRSKDELHAIDRLIPGAIQRVPQDVTAWWRELPSGCGIVVCDSSGGESGLRVAETLQQYGTDAGYLVDGFVGWYERGFPTRRAVSANVDKWVTREHPKIDRIACPWMIRRFINPLAEFIYVSPNEVVAHAEASGATSYDVKDARFGHVGDRCSFDAIIRTFELHDPALDRLALIVRGADTSRPDLAAQCEGLVAISHGLSANFPDDHTMLAHGMILYDALYTWCRNQA
jgi:rhodanese-related sulfurtransferase